MDAPPDHGHQVNKLEGKVNRGGKGEGGGNVEGRSYCYRWRQATLFSQVHQSMCSFEQSVPCCKRLQEGETEGTLWNVRGGERSV